MPPEAYTARTIAIVDDTGTEQAVDKAYEELTKWGKLKVIQSTPDADMGLVVEVDKETGGVTANTYGSTTTVNDRQVVTIATSFILKGRLSPFFYEQSALRFSETARLSAGLMI